MFKLHKRVLNGWSCSFFLSSHSVSYWRLNRADHTTELSHNFKIRPFPANMMPPDTVPVLVGGIGGGRCKVCVIGAGPSGLGLLCWVSKLGREGRNTPDLVCYEKQGDCCGLWNYSWRTGIDEFGEPVHGSMYRFVLSTSVDIFLSLRFEESLV